MEKIYYSSSTRGFYSASVHGARTIMVPDPNFVPGDGQTVEDAPLVEMDNPDCMLPVDAVEISDDDHMALLQAQSEGKVIKADADGKPVAADTEPPTNEQLATAVRAERDRLLTDSDWTQKRDVVLPNDAEWVAYRQALRDVPEQSGFPSSIKWPEAPK